MTASIIIPAFNHADVLAEAIDSALAQTVACEVIVIDDGSTDQTQQVIARYPGITTILLPHGGPSIARNAGIDAAKTEFVMFLDADDIIAATKVEEQLAEMQPEVGWVLSDVRIEDAASGQVQLASERYGYSAKQLNGWIKSLLDDANFIPIMSPLVRRSVLGDDIRFHDELVPEDWHFWRAVAAAARVRYVPRVLATYRKSRTGRSRIPKTARYVVRNIEPPLRLNLGCGTKGTRSWHPIAGMVNLDKSMGWSFEDGLGDFVDHSVAGITISHALMYVALDRWPALFTEFARVIDEGGVVRITEDETRDPRSSRLGGWRGSEPAVTLTDAEMVKAHLTRAGFAADDVDAKTSRFRDRSLCQAQHGDPPNVFFVEGVKLPGTFFAPHSDDETLFGAFTILRYRPRVVICFPSAGDYGATAVREAETRSAMEVLGAKAVEQWHGGDIAARMRAFDAQVHPVRVWAPSRQTSHADHRAVANAAREVFGDRVIAYHTYDAKGKVRSGKAAPFELPWVSQKLRAMARYQTQINHPRANQFFVQDLMEYLE